MKTSAEQITDQLLNNLWLNFKKRVPYAGIYSKMVTDMGGTYVTDHISFRTLNTTTGEQPPGILAISHLFKSLKFVRKGTCRFEKHGVKSALFEHEDQRFPLIFVSELEVTELPPWARNIVMGSVCESPYLLSDEAIELMNYLETDGYINSEAAEILTEELTGFFRRPWDVPDKQIVLKINDISQYAAWVLLHGNSVCHFAAAFHPLNNPVWPDLETACKALSNAGVPMRERIEGEKNSRLRQAVTLPVHETIIIPLGEDDADELDWTYAFFEITERGFVNEGDVNKLFRGFIAEQTSHIMSMTQNKDS